MCRPKAETVLAACLLALTMATAAAAQPPERQVNSTTPGFQGLPSVAALGSGFVVVWESDVSAGSDVSSTSVQGQRFDAFGTPLGGEFQVNAYTTGAQGLPSVAALAGGGFVVVWQSDGSGDTDVSSTSVQGRRFDAAGTALGGELQVNTYTTDAQGLPSVAATPGGGFVVAWQSRGSSGTDTSSYSVQARRFDAAGAPLGGEFQVNSHTPSYQRYPSLAVAADGAFLVAWTSDGSPETDSSFLSVQGRVFDPAGIPLAEQFQVNGYTTNAQRLPSVAAADGGGFLVAWSSLGSNGTDASGSSVQARRFDAAGMALGAEVQVNASTAGVQTTPRAVAVAAGGFVVAWTSESSAGSDASGYSVQARSLDAAGAPLPGELQVNTTTASDQTYPALVQAPGGEFVVVWQSLSSAGTDASAESVQVRLLAAPAAGIPALAPAGLAVLAAVLGLLAVGALGRRRIKTEERP